MAGAVGTATLDFGAAPGTNIVSVVVTGQASITGTSSVEAFMMGTDSTATHNTYEHSMVPIRLSCIAIAAGTGFTIQGISETRLTGTFVIRWVWSD
jgi:hypothetical protein